jgi:hypothetical protein
MSNRRKLRGGPVPGPAPHLVPPPGVRTEAFVPVDLRESATATIERVQVDEASTTAKIRSTGARRYRARLIEGNRWGSSGYYPRKVLERDGPTAWPAGTLMYLDHPTPTEEAERPERSVRDLAARTTTAPVYEGDGLYADIEVFAHAAPLVEALAATIGLSVRGEGTATFGEVAGRQGMIIESLDRGYSVDFVTRAGAGGALVSLLESARAAGVRVREDRNVGAWIESRLHLGLTQLGDNMYGNGYLSRDERITLSSAVGDALQAFTARVEADAPQLFQRDLYDGPPDADDPAGATAVSEASSEDIRRVLDDLLHDAYPTGQNGYLWVRDYDADRHLVWFDVNPDDDGDCGTYEQSYAIGDNGQLSLTGTRTEVVARTVYSPVTPDTEDVAEAHRPPATAPAPTPAAPPASTSTTSTTPSTSGGAPPTEPIPRKESTVDPTNTGPAPGAAGAAGGGQATPVTEADPGSAARIALLERERDDAVTRAQALTEARTDQARAIAERDQAINEARQLRADGTARTTIARMVGEAANVPDTMRALIAPRVADRVVGRVPLTEAGDVNTEALTAAVTSAIEAESTYAASILEAAGAGRVAGLGGSLRPGELSEADFEKGMAKALQESGMPADLAQRAAKGR